jgi:hypothetical protein
VDIIFFLTISQLFLGLKNLLFIGKLSEKLKNGDFSNFALSEINNLETSKTQIWDFATISEKNPPIGLSEIISDMNWKACRTIFNLKIFWMATARCRSMPDHQNMTPGVHLFNQMVVSQCDATTRERFYIYRLRRTLL